MGFFGNIFGKIRKALLPACRTIKSTFKIAIDKLTAAARRVVDYAKAHPWKFAGICILIIGGILVIALPPVLGFGAGGIAAGSAAAAIHASIGNVAAGSFFALMQSLTMTGVLYWIGTAMVVAGVALASYWSGESSGESPAAVMAKVE